MGRTLGVSAISSSEIFRLAKVEEDLKMPSTKPAANRWVRNYARAWGEKDAKAIASLFAEDAAYHSHPFRAAN